MKTVTISRIAKEDSQYWNDPKPFTTVHHVECSQCGAAHDYLGESNAIASREKHLTFNCYAGMWPDTLRPQDRVL